MKGYRFITDQYELFQLIYVSAGELLFETDSETRFLGPGELVLLREGSAFVLSCPRRSYHGVSFHATGALPPAFFGLSEAIRASAELHTLAKLMEQQFSEPCPESATILEGLGRTMAWQAIRISGQKSASRGRVGMDHADAARQILDATLYTARSARDVLASLPISYRQLARRFTKSFGLSPKQYQLKARINEARRLLRETRLHIIAVAMELGYCSSQHFATQFLAQTGLTPSEYRESSQKESSKM
ncbi:MAG: helix-turn-helix transcriptional regulator [Lentisphaerae bacterium]|nr:helix-turn-helix transcriptional regulator [Lentisphaerota bacterium]